MMNKKQLNTVKNEFIWIENNSKNEANQEADVKATGLA